MPICRAMGLETFDSTLIDGSLFALWDNSETIAKALTSKTMV
jgi:hypothetical protein